MLTAVDIVSVEMLGSRVIEKKPGAVYASSLIPFAESVFDAVAKPAKGVVVSHSCWLSSLGLLADPDTAVQGEFLRDAGISFPAMPDREREKLVEWGEAQGLAVLFDGDQIS